MSRFDFEFCAGTRREFSSGSCNALHASALPLASENHQKTCALAFESRLAKSRSKCKLRLHKVGENVVLSRIQFVNNGVVEFTRHARVKHDTSRRPKRNQLVAELRAKPGKAIHQRRCRSCRHRCVEQEGRKAGRCCNRAEREAKGKAWAARTCSFRRFAAQGAAHKSSTERCR